MISGRVTGSTAVIAVRVTGPDGDERLDAAIDTGYNGYLTIPERLVAACNFPFAGYRRGTLADGSVVVLNVYLATVTWHARRREVLVSQVEGTPLVGMAMLHGNRLVMDVTDGGRLTIEELSQGA